MNVTPEFLRWLTRANERYGEEGLSHRQRPFRAMVEYAREHHCSVEMPSPMATFIFKWFSQQSPPEAHTVRFMFTGAFFFDTAFWPLQIPVVYGEARLGPLDCLPTVPAAVKARLAANATEISRLAVYWADCLDYGYGHQESECGRRLSKEALRFLDAGHKELTGALSQLLDTRPNTKALLGLRMAVEIFLKTILVQEKGLDEAALRRLSHRLSDVARECEKATGDISLSKLESEFTVFPAVEARYEAAEYPLMQVWRGAAVTQAIAATVTRRYSDRNIGAELIVRTGKPPSKSEGPA
jgi:hypothetical protein